MTGCANGLFGRPMFLSVTLKRQNTTALAADIPKEMD